MAEKETGQIEAFSDGAFAVAITLLMLVTLIPFPTSLVAEYLCTPYAKTALAVYCGLNFGMALVFNLLWNHVASGGRLLEEDHDRHRVRHITT